MKLSDWQDGDTYPKFQGVYQRSYSLGVRYCYFSDNKWYLNGGDVEEAKRFYKKGNFSWNPCVPWRGVIER